MSTEPKVVVNGKEYPIPETFTLGELADMEKITGQDYDLSKGGVLGTLALAYVSIRRIDQTVTVDDLRGLSPEDFSVEADAGPPAEGAPSVSAPPSSESSANGSDGSPAPTPEPSGTPV